MHEVLVGGFEKIFPKSLFVKYFTSVKIFLITMALKFRFLKFCLLSMQVNCPPPTMGEFSIGFNASFHYCILIAVLQTNSLVDMSVLHSALCVRGRSQMLELFMLKTNCKFQ